MNGTGFPDESRAEFLKNRIYGRENPPETIRVHRVVGRVDDVLIEADWIWNLDRHRPDFRFDAQRRERCFERAIKISYAARRERDRFRFAAAGGEPQHVADEIELRFEDSQAVRNCRRRQSPSADI